MTSAAINGSKRKQWDVVVVGAGFAGLYLLYKLRVLGLSATVLERAEGVGGTWFWNRYPGARCDVESLQYSYSFSEDLEQEWDWTERFATQPEILRYLNYVADRFELRQDIQFNKDMTGAEYSGSECAWTVRTGDGDVLHAQFVIMATGCLSIPRRPEIEGLSNFKGSVYFTGSWPDEPVDFSKRRVGVIGTGSSGIQAIPVIAEQAASLVVFQRTPNFSLPARNHPLDPEHQRVWKRDYASKRIEARHSQSGTLLEVSNVSALQVTAGERESEYERRWQRGGPGLTRAYNDLLRKKEANDTAAEFVRSKILKIVRSTRVASALLPTDYPIGTKRVCVDTDYYETFNRPNVSLVDLRETPIVRLVPLGIETDTRAYQFDDIVFATGFDAMTGAIDRVRISNSQGELLKHAWSTGPRTYLGLMSNGFPNLFFVTGPGSPSVLSNMVVSIEQHVDWIADCIASMRKNHKREIQPERSAQEAWSDHVADLANQTLFPSAASWYRGANVPGKPRVFMPYVGGVGNYRKACSQIADNNYSGFSMLP